jgi:serine O-acetyltransferase
MWQRFKQDARRYIKAGKVAPPDGLTWKVLLRLLYRYMSLRAIAWYRFGTWCRQKHIPIIGTWVQHHLLRAYGLEIVVGADIGGGLYIAHPVGAVIAPQRMGENCSVIAAVTIGMRNTWAFPVFGDNVFIGAGARILGDITIGDGAVIGANAVVIDNVPDGATVVGIPARVTRINGARVYDGTLDTNARSAEEDYVLRDM